MNIVERAKNIIMAPAAEWNVIEPEITPPKELYLNYIVILAAIGPLARFIGGTLFGVSTPFGTIRTSFIYGVVTLVVGYLIGLAVIFLIGLVSDFLAPKFGGVSNQMQAMKLTAYALTPGMVASILGLIPSALISLLLFLVALYGIYVYYIGAPVLMKVPREKAGTYTAAVIAIVIVIVIIVGTLFALTGVFRGGYSGMGIADPGMNDRQARADVAAAQIAAATAQIQNAANQMQANGVAQPTGNGNSQTAAVNAQAAAGNALAALAGAGNGSKVEPVDKELLKGLLPASAGGLTQTGLEATKTGIAGLQMTVVEGKYGDDSGKHMELGVTDIGGSGMVAMAAAWSMVEVDSSDNNGYEKSGKVNGRPTHEKFDKNGPSSEYAVLIADRFLVAADGNVAMSTLKDAVASIDAGKLEAFKSQSVH